MCENCGKFCGEDNEFGKLEAAHYHGRRKESVRFDEDNVNSLCFSCHQRFHKDTTLHTAFMKRKLGQRGYDLLQIRANTPLRGTKQMQDDMVKLFCREELKRLDENNIPG